MPVLTQDAGQWIPVTERLPDVVESFSDGTRFHGEVFGWFPRFAKYNWRKAAVFSHPDTGPRFMTNAGEGYGAVEATHWMPLPLPPKDNGK